MKKALKTIFGLVITFVLFIVYMIDRVILTFIPWKPIPTFETWDNPNKYFKVKTQPDYSLINASFKRIFILALNVALLIAINHFVKDWFWSAIYLLCIGAIIGIINLIVGVVATWKITK